MHYCFRFIVLLLFLFSSVNGRIESFNNKKLEEGSSISNKIVFLTADDSFIGNDKPTFQVNQSFTLIESTNITSASVLEVLFFPTTDYIIGLTDDEGLVQYCCTEELIKDEKCSTLNTLLIAELTNQTSTLERKTFTFVGNNDEYKWAEQWTIKKSGVYELLYVNCKNSNIDVGISGSITYSNPFGQLSAESYPLLWFFGIITVLMILITIYWIVTLIIFRSSLISLQYFIFTLLLLELLEAFTWFLMFWVTNQTGVIRWGWITLTVFTSSVKRTSVGLLYLLISLGYGIMNKARIGSNKRLIIIVIGFYFIVSTAQELITSFLREGIVSSDTEVLLGFVSLILLFPSVVIPLGLFWWICSCLSKTIQKLKLRNNEIKLDLYTKIFISLIVSCIVTVLMILLQTGVSIVDSDQMWRVWWLFTAFWFMLFFGLSMSLLILFNPKKNKHWLSHTSRGIIDDDDDFSSNVEIELDNLDDKDVDVAFDFDLGFEDIIEEESSKIS